MRGGVILKFYMNNSDKKILAEKLTKLIPLMHFVIFRMNNMLSEPDRKDIVSDTIFKLMQRHDIDHENKSFKNFVTYCARNTYIDWYRGKLKRQSINNRIPEDYVEKDSGARFDLCDIGDDRLKNFISKFVKPLNMAIFLKHVEGYKDAEVAAMFGLTVNATKCRLFITKEKIRSKLIKSKALDGLYKIR